MEIECYIYESCTSETLLRDNIQKALEFESAEADVNFYRINDAEAQRLGLLGSPTVLINGTNIMPGDMPGIG